MLNECNGCEYQCNLSHIDICTLGSPCPHQRSTPMTEQEYLQTCNTEQLAEWMALRLNPGILLALRMKYHCTDINAVREWLKQPHTQVESKLKRKN